MKSKLLFLLVLVSGYLFAQDPALKIPLVVSNGTEETTLYFGLDPNATGGIDAALGEEELPPLPPSEIFDARFINATNANLGEGSAKDYRTGTTSGTYQFTHQLKIQKGTGTGRILTYDLPSGVTLTIQDNLTGGIINEILTGSGSYTFTLDLDNVKMTADYDLLATPYNLLVDDSTPGEIGLSWDDDNTNETGFIIERKDPASTSFTELARTAADVTTYTDNTVEQTLTYTYRIKAYNDGGESLASNEDEGTVGISPINSPSGLTGDNSVSGEIGLSWTDNSDNEDEFVIEREDPATQAYVELGTTGQGETTFTDQTVAEGTTYKYRVKAANTLTESGYSNVLEITSAVKPISAPTELVGDNSVLGEIGLSWTDNSDNEDEFIIEREDPATQAYVELGTTGQGETTFTDQTVAEGTTYKYRVKAANTLIESGYSNVLEITSAVEPISAPTELVGDNNVLGEIGLSWTDNSDNEDKFIVEREDPATQAYVELGTTVEGATTYTDQTVAEGTTYKYRVKAANTLTESGYSNVLEITSAIKPISAPTNLTGDNTVPGEIGLSWTDNSDNEDKFIIEREDPATQAYVELGTTGEGATTYTDQTVAEGTTYKYRVKAANTLTESGYSNVLEITSTIKPISAPTNLTGDNTVPGEIGLSWTDNSDNEDKFIIEREDPATQAYVELGTTGEGETTYTDQTVAEETTYKYRVKAANTLTESGYSNVLEITSAIELIDAPTELVGDNSVFGEIGLSWTDNSDNEDKFIIEREDPATQAYVELGTTGQGETTYTDQTVAEGTTYKYRVKAANTLAESGYSNILEITSAVGLIAAPTELVGDNSVFGEIGLSWTDNSDNEDEFIIEREDPATQAYVELGTTVEGATTYTDQTVAEGTTYKYRVKAANTFTESGYSNVLEITSAVEPIAAPTELVGDNTVPEEIGLSWTDNSDNEDKFIIEREDPATQAYVELGTTGQGETTYTDQTVAEGTTYKYRVKAANTFTESGYSNILEITTLVVGVDGPLTGIPNEYILQNNYPNPFNPSTIIRFGVPFRSNVNLEIYNILGQRVQTLVNEDLDAGYYEFQFDASQIASGVYIYHLSAESQINDKNFQSIKKMMYLK